MKYFPMKKFIVIIIITLVFFHKATAQVGKVGINTTSPAAMLHVKDSSVVFTGPASLPADPGTPPVSGSGSRLMWYPDKAAFRVGAVGGTQWNETNIGNISFAAGYNTKASGSYSSALGSQTTASGYYSTAIGEFTVASGNTAVALGSQSEASGHSSFSTGFLTNSVGDFSSSMGINTDANAYASFVIGRYNDPTYLSATSWNQADPLFIIGNGTSNFRSNALTVLKNARTGINTTSPLAMLHVNNGSVVFANTSNQSVVNPPISGAGTRMMWYHSKSAFRAGNVDADQWDQDSIGFYSIALGKDVKARGYKSTAFGSGNTAYGEASTAFGMETFALGWASTSLGWGTVASGGRSLAVCHFTKAQGENSLSTGVGTVANGYGSTVVGMFNDSIIAAQTNGASPTTPLFIVGNGTTYTARSNAFTVLKNGNIGIGTSAPGYLLNFPNALGDKISLWGNSGAHYGFGIQSNALQIHTDVVNSDVVFGHGSSASLTETMRVKGNGRVGIGTNSPAFKLDVADRIRIRTGSGGETAGLWLNKADNTAVVSFIGMYSDSYVGIYSELGASWNFLMNLYNGNIGIGITPTQKLHVSGNGLFTGTVTASCGVLVCSDIRYKTNIRPLSNSLSNVLALRGIYYDWNKEVFPEKHFDDRSQIGFAAQDLEKIYPEMVHTDEEGFKTVDYSRLTPVLVEAIKEQQVMINTQDEKINTQSELLRSQQKQIDFLKRELVELKDRTNSIVNRQEGVEAINEQQEQINFLLKELSDLKSVSGKK